jgi:hypothetical protein
VGGCCHAEDHEPGADRGDGSDLPYPDAFVQDARADHEQEHEPHREYRLHDGERRDQEGGGLEDPSEGHEQRAREPTPLNGESGEQRWPQGLRLLGLAGVEGLNGDPAVVERRGEDRADHAEGEEAHA